MRRRWGVLLVVQLKLWGEYRGQSLEVIVGGLKQLRTRAKTLCPMYHQISLAVADGYILGNGSLMLLGSRLKWSKNNYNESRASCCNASEKPRNKPTKP